MRKPFLKLVALCFGIILGSCSTFYTRHYTRGIFYDGLGHKAQPAMHVEKPALAVVVQQTTDKPLRGDMQTGLSDEKIILPKEKQAFARPENKAVTAIRKLTVQRPVSLPVLKKALQPVQCQIRATKHSNSVAGKAAFYILALVLAVAIVALAIYFLPAILLPAQVVTTFTTILLIGAIVVVCVFAFLIYTLIGLLIDLFRHKKTPEEEEEEESF